MHETLSSATDPPLPSVISSRRGFDGKLLHVRVDDVRLPSGRESVREVVEHPGAVAIVAVTCDAQVLLIRQTHYSIQRTLLGLPAGTRKPGESAEECARRELLEETGYHAGPMTQIAAYYTSPGFTDELMIIFLARDCVPGTGGPNPDELILLAPTPLAEIAGLVAPGATQVEEGKTLIGLLLLLREV